MLLVVFNCVRIWPLHFNRTTVYFNNYCTFPLATGKHKWKWCAFRLQCWIWEKGWISQLCLYYGWCPADNSSPPASRSVWMAQPPWALTTELQAVNSTLLEKQHSTLLPKWGGTVTNAQMSFSDNGMQLLPRGLREEFKGFFYLKMQVLSIVLLLQSCCVPGSLERCKEKHSNK